MTKNKITKNEAAKDNAVEIKVPSLQEVAVMLEQSDFLVVEPLPETSRDGHSEYMVEPHFLVPVCRALKASGFGFLADVTAVDYLDADVFRLLYQVCNFQNSDTITLKLDIPRVDPVVESLCAVWPAANWPEREVYDMFGIVFKDHPQLERILMWEGFEGWPLRKDFEHQPSKYQGRRRLDEHKEQREQQEQE